MTKNQEGLAKTWELAEIKVKIVVVGQKNVLRENLYSQENSW